MEKKNIQTDAELAEALNGHPPVIIHEEDRRAYFTALEAWDKAQDLNPLCDFLREQTVKTWGKSLPRWEKQRK